MKKITILLALLFLIVSCKTVKNKSLDGDTRSKQAGWIDGDTYALVVVGAWDRDRYYIEGETAVSGKEAKSSLLLEDDAKRAATVKAMRDFLEKSVGAYVKSKTGVEDGKLIGDIIQSGVEGKVPSPIAGVEQYTAMHDCRITFTFKADGLEKIISDASERILTQTQAP